MAKSKATVITSVTLELDQKEAEALFSVLFLVGGDPEKTPRGLLDEVRDALGTAGVSRADAPMSGSVYFDEVKS